MKFNLRDPAFGCARSIITIHLVRFRSPARVPERRDIAGMPNFVRTTSRLLPTLRYAHFLFLRIVQLYIDRDFAAQQVSTPAHPTVP